MKSFSVVFLVALTGTAAAQPGMVAPTVQPVSRDGELSESAAVALSIGGTVASWGLLLASDGDTAATIGAIGTFVGPSIGHWYAGSFGTRGMGLRAVGVAAALSGALIALSECPLFSGEECQESGGAQALLLLGAGLYVGGTIDDIVSAPARVRARNEERQLQIVPMMRKGSGGVALSGRF